MALFYRFTSSDLQEEEEVVYRVHPYFISFFVRARGGVFWMIVGGGLFSILYALVGFDLIHEPEIGLFILLLSGIPFLVGFSVVVKQMIDWWFDEGIITNKRVVVIDQESFFDKKLESVDLKQVSDVKVQQQGFLYSFLDIGTLDVRTESRVVFSSGDEDRMLIRDIRKPKKVSQLLSKVIMNRNEKGVDYAKLCLECGL